MERRNTTPQHGLIRELCVAPAACTAARWRWGGTTDHTKSEIPIAHALTHRGSYLSGFSTPAGARNPSTKPERLLSGAQMGIADVHGCDLVCQLSAPISVVNSAKM